MHYTLKIKIFPIVVQKVLKVEMKTFKGNNKREKMFMKH
jgi:hypothetical protein